MGIGLPYGDTITMARSLKSAARTTTTTSVQESAPVPLQGQWPTAAFAAVSAALTYAVRPCETLLELQDIYKPLAPRLESPKTQVAVLPLSWKNTTLSVYQNQQFDAIFAVDLADLVNNPQNLVTDFYRIVNKCKMFVNITTRVVPTDSSNHMAVGWETILPLSSQSRRRKHLMKHCSQTEQASKNLMAMKPALMYAVG
jgi:hypothetical protein